MGVFPEGPMDHMLQFVLVLVLVVLGAFLVPLLLQLYRTAKAVQALAESAREDLREISHEIHEARLQMERVAALAEKSLEFPVAASSLAANLTRSLGSFLDPDANPWVTALMTGLKIGLDFLRRPSTDAATKEMEK